MDFFYDLFELPIWQFKKSKKFKLTILIFQWTNL